MASDLRTVDLYVVTEVPDASGSVVTVPELVVEGALAYLGRPRADLWYEGAGEALVYELSVMFRRIPQNDTVWEYVWDLDMIQNLWVVVMDRRSAWYMKPYRCIEIRQSDGDVRARGFFVILYCEALSSKDRVLLDMDRLEGRPP